MMTWRKSGATPRPSERRLIARLLATGLVCLSLGTAASVPAQVIYQPKPEAAPARTVPLELNGAPLPDALLGRRYAQTFPVDGGVPPYAITFSGHLPDGMRAVATGNTVLLEGVPQSIGDYPLKLSLTDKLGQSQTGNYLLHVTPNSTNAPASITVNEGLKAADNLGSGGGVADMETVVTADSIMVKLNGSTVGNIFSVSEAIKTADSITVKINGSTVGNIFSVPESIKAVDAITIQLNGSTVGGAFSVPEGIKTSDAITILLNGLTAGSSGPSVPESIKTADTITILLNGLTVGGSGSTIPETIKTADTITIKLNGSVIGGVADVPEAIKTADSITITLNGVKVSGIADVETVKTTDSISILIDGLSPGGGRPVTAAEGIKALDAITVTLNGATVTSSVPAYVREEIKTSDQITVTLNGQTATALSIVPTPVPDAVYGAAYSQTFTPSGGTGAAVTFGHSGALPAGLSFSGGTGSLTISGTPSVTGSFPLTLTASDGTSNATLNATVVVDQATQSINLGTLPTPAYGGASFSVSATSTSGLPVTISYVSGPATGSGSGPYTATGTGTVNFTATQAGNANYAPAAPVNFSVNVAAASQTINLGPLPTPTFGGAPFNVSATSTSGLPVTIAYVSGPATGSGSGPYTATGTGTVNFTATQAGNANYAPAAPVNFSVTIGAASQSITIGPLPTPTFGGSPFSVSATASSGLPVTIAYVSGPATGSGNGPYTATGAGTVNFTATQAGNANYAAAAPVSFSVNIAPASQSITLGTLPTPTFGGAPFSLSATASSGLPVTFTYISGPASGAGNGPYIPTGAGTVSFTATQAGNTSYLPATPVNFSLGVAKQASVTTVSANPLSITPVQTTTLTANVAAAVTGSPTGTVTFFDNGVPIGSPVTVVGGRAQLTTLLLSGSQAISATYSGDGNFLASSSTTSATVSVAPLDFTMTPLSSVSLNVVPGSSAVVSFNVSPLYLIYPAPVTFTVSGLPSNAKYTVTPTSVAANGGPQTVTVTIQTAPALVQNARPFGPRSAPLALAVFVPLLVLGTLRRRRRWLSELVLMLGAFAGSAVVGCGANGGNGFFGQAPQTYPVVITATSGTVQHTINVSLVVQ
jgi:hypothetical protein